MAAFSTGLVISGPLRSPRQMLADQEYDGHASVHDDATAEKLGLAGAPIEGPTHFSQFDPIGVTLWGSSWFERGCISAHFENMVVEGEQVQATARTESPALARISAAKADGTPVLSGTMSLGDADTTELGTRLAALKPAGDLFIIDRLSPGESSPVARGTMTFSSRNGNLYPFSLAEKLACITEDSPWYSPATAGSSPWGRAVVPYEMVSVLAANCPAAGSVRGPAVGLFMDLEIKMHSGPVFVDQEYELRREVVALGQTRRVEFYFTRTTLTDPADGRLVASVLLNQGVFKASYGDYPADRL
ncbi:MAG: hypothetical protein RJA51_864 [Actinomycetota bacterium]|jgi:hypothetical protein